MSQHLSDDPFQMRLYAEQTCDPEAYERAAALFDRDGFQEAARRCWERAEHYRELSSMPVMEFEKVRQ